MKPNAMQYNAISSNVIEHVYIYIYYVFMHTYLYTSTMS